MDHILQTKLSDRLESLTAELDEFLTRTMAGLKPAAEIVAEIAELTERVVRNNVITRTSMDVKID